MAKDKNKKDTEKSVVEVAKELGGVLVCVRDCYKQYECEKCIQEKQK